MKIERDELWPYYFVTEGTYGRPVNVTDEVVERWDRVQREFEQMQNEMDVLYLLSEASY